MVEVRLSEGTLLPRPRDRPTGRRRRNTIKEGPVVGVGEIVFPSRLERGRLHDEGQRKKTITGPTQEKM